MFPGDQHKLSVPGQNPFEEPRISQYTATEIATLQAKLDQQLGPEFISSRPGAGGKKVHYIQADKCINLANQVFGFNGWSSSIQRVDVDFLDHGKDGKWSIGVSVTMRVTLKDGTFHEDIGYGQMENGKTKAQVFEKAKKEGTTDGLKRALRNFGKVLGNCLYDKEYLDRISRIKAPVPSFDEKRLHRYNEPAAIVKAKPVDLITAKDPPSSPEAYDEYGGKEFEELGIFSGGDDVFDDLMPGEVLLETKRCTPNRSPLQDRSAPSDGRKSDPPTLKGPEVRNQSGGRQTPINSKPQDSSHGPYRSMAPPAVAAPPQYQLPPKTGPQQAQLGGIGQSPRTINNPAQRPSRPPQQVLPQQPQQQPQTPSIKPLPPPRGQETPPTSVHHNPPIGFYTGKAAYGLIGEDRLLPEQAPTFNPHRQTTIPRSSGIDHTKSSPVPRKLQTPNERPEMARPNFENPSLNSSRQIGLPPQNRAPFRTPGSAVGTSIVGSKRPAESAPTNGTRTALTAASGAHLNVQNNNGSDQKRTRI